MKLTKRKQFNFFRSYYDVYNEIPNDKDKLAFIDALFTRQFLGVKPEGLTGMAKFAYISQTNSIDSQVKGYEDKTKTKLNPLEDNNYTPTEGGKVTPIAQVEEKEKEEVQYVKWYGFFLDDWNKYKIKYKKQKSNLRTLDVSSQDNLKQIAKDFSKEDIKKAIVGLLMQKVFPNDGDYTTDPRHLLKDGGIFINKYIDAQENNKRNIYGKSEVE